MTGKAPTAMAPISSTAREALEAPSPLLGFVGGATTRWAWAGTVVVVDVTVEPVVVVSIVVVVVAAVVEVDTVEVAKGWSKG